MPRSPPCSTPSPPAPTRVDQAATRLTALASDLDHRITICSARLDEVMPPGDPGWDDLGHAPPIPAPRR